MLQNTRGGIFPGAEERIAANSTQQGPASTATLTGATGLPPAPTYDAPADPHMYVVTAHKPSAVISSVKANFTADDEVNLIFTKCTRVEVLTLTPEGLKAVCDVPIFGRVSALKVLRPPKASRDQLFLLTDERDYFALSWDAEHHEFKTEFSGDARQSPAVPLERFLTAVAPDGTVAVLHTYQGMLQVVRLAGEVQSTFVVRLDDAVLDDLQFLFPSAASGSSTSEMAALKRDQNTGVSCLQVYSLNVDTEDLKPVWSVSSLDSGAAFVVPLPAPRGGCAVLAETSITSFQDGIQAAFAPIERSLLTTWGPVGEQDDGRFLACASSGTIYLLDVTQSNIAMSVASPAGRATHASTVTYLDNGYVFLGSQYANSQLVKLTPQGDTVMIQECENYVNIGPMVDFKVADLDNIGQGQLVACCNTGVHGSLRLISNGIGISEQASIELQGVRGIWSLKDHIQAEHDRYLIITFVESTHVLAMSQRDELDEASIPGFVTDCMTLFCGTLAGGARAVQIMQRSVRLIDHAAGGVLGTWNVPGTDPIAKVASTGDRHVLLATGQGALWILEFNDSGIECVAQADLQSEVACLDMAAWLQDDGSRLAAVGTWTSKVLLLELPSMQVVHTQQLDTGTLPRSAMFMATSTGPVLLLGMGDGQLMHWQIGPKPMLLNRKTVTLGFKPISLSPFSIEGRACAFAASDRPAVVYEHGGRLLYNPVNDNNVMHVCSFSSPAFPGALAMAKEDCLMIALMDAIQKLHIRSIGLGEHPRRIAHQPSSATFAVVTIMPQVDASAVKILSQQTWEEVAALQLEPDEAGCSVTTLPHPEKPGRELYAVGTAFVVREEPEPRMGRILLLELNHASGGAGGDAAELCVVGALTVRGAVYSLSAFELPDVSGRLLATVNHVVCVFALTLGGARGTEGALALECSRQARVMALFVSVTGRTVLVGDLMHSVELFHYHPEDHKIELVAAHHQAQWMSAVCAIDDRCHMATDNDGNLAIYRYHADADEDQTRGSMDMVARFNVGDFVNRILPGSLVMQLPDAEFAAAPSFIMISVLGMISLVVLLPQKRFTQLLAIQDVMESRVQGIGGLLHSSWRAFRRQGSLPPAPAQNALDGDLLEQLLDMPRSSVAEIVSEVVESERVEVDELLKVLEDLQRLH